MFRTPLQVLEDTIPFFSKEKYEDNKFHYYNLNEYIEIYFFKISKILLYASPLIAIIPWYYYNFHYIACLICIAIIISLVSFGIVFAGIWIQLFITFIDKLSSFFTFGLIRYVFPPLPLSHTLDTVRIWLLETKYSKEYLKRHHYDVYETLYIYGGEGGVPPKYALPPSVYDAYMRGEYNSER